MTNVLRFARWANIAATLVVTAFCAAPTDAAAYWVPPKNLTWYWQLSGKVNNSHPAMVYDIDGFDNTASEVAALHAVGKKVICYIEVGAAENYRPDYAQFPAYTLGNVIPDYSNERYIDIRNPVVVSIVKNRIKMCVDKGFDAIEPDLDESYRYNTGFPLTKANEEAFMTPLTNYAHGLGLAMFGKNPDDTGDDYAADMVDVFDGVITEQCNEYATCSLLNGYLAAGKPVLNAEYRSSSYPGFWTYDNAHGITGALFNINLAGGTFKSCRDSSSATPH